MSRILCLGRVQRSKGIQGEARVTSFGELLASAAARSRFTLFSAQGIEDGLLLNANQNRHVTLEKVHRHSNTVLFIKFSGFETADDVEKIKGLYVGITLDEARERFYKPGSEPWLFLYLDLQVFDHNDCEYGYIKRIEEPHETVIFVIELTENKNEILVAANDPAILTEDFENNRIVIEDFESISAAQS